MTAPSINLLRAEKATLLIWLVFVAMTFAGDLIKPTAMGSSLSWLLLGGIFGVMLSAVFRVVHHAECLAVIFGEPYGTLILTLSVIGLKSATMVSATRPL